ncbi:uncharacterized protein PpBr36_09299 [Pyricularia pennisetigena]|uniref:uncharacterized protein n=1 Tax=Pyricularia pennisetigena TaxID=1578925 RepID=UPI00114E52EB|nr:uncharacterized protein PpBr36_09299 [Pyricularia pennisetigena]TLS21653.1 hypothetical protein PpBr36_09299 [Pyricularia pennisetigena]
MSNTTTGAAKLPNLGWMKAQKGEQAPWDPASNRPFHPEMSFSADVVSHTTDWPRVKGDGRGRDRWTGELPMPRHVARGAVLEKYVVWRHFAENPAEVPSALGGGGRAVAPGAHGKRLGPLTYVKRALAALNRELGTCCVCAKSKMTCYHHDLRNLEREYRNMKSNDQVPEIIERATRNFKTVSDNNARSTAKRGTAALPSSPVLFPGPAPSVPQTFPSGLVPDFHQIPHLDNPAVSVASSSVPFSFEPMNSGPADGFESASGFYTTTSVGDPINAGPSFDYGQPGTLVQDINWQQDYHLIVGLDNFDMVVGYGQPAIYLQDPGWPQNLGL